MLRLFFVAATLIKILGAVPPRGPVVCSPVVVVGGVGEREKVRERLRDGEHLLGRESLHLKIRNNGTNTRWRTEEGRGNSTHENMGIVAKQTRRMGEKNGVSARGEGYSNRLHYVAIRCETRIGDDSRRRGRPHGQQEETGK